MTDVTSFPSSVNSAHQRALRGLLRNLIGFVGAPPHKAPQPKPRRLLYRRPASLTDSELDTLIREIGIARVWAATERATSPELALVAAE